MTLTQLGGVPAGPGPEPPVLPDAAAHPPVQPQPPQPPAASGSTTPDLQQMLTIEDVSKRFNESYYDVLSADTEAYDVKSATGDEQFKQLVKLFGTQASNIQRLMASHPDLDVRTLIVMRQQDPQALDKVIDILMHHPNWTVKDVVGQSTDGRLVINPIFLDPKAMKYLDAHPDIRPSELDQEMVDNAPDPTAIPVQQAKKGGGGHSQGGHPDMPVGF